MPREHYTIVIAGNVETCRAEAEISDEAENRVGVVYEGEDGWHTELLEGYSTLESREFDAVVVEAKQVLSRYVNRRGIIPRRDLMSELWRCG